MEAQPDFKELLELLNAHAVEFVIVGADADGRLKLPAERQDSRAP